jgi:tRNA-uridine 2-sulfurtransferase
MRERVVVAMSGGVDSSVAAALLASQGYEVIGITMCFNLPDAGHKKPRCCGLSGIEDAQRVARILNIRHYVVSMQRHLAEHVIKDFCAQYLKGRTPNPCVRCNQYLKFDVLLRKALSLGAGHLATGHYARIIKEGDGAYGLARAKDTRKDQSYFLYRLSQRQLAHALFPLGAYTKEKVRRLAREFHLPVAEKKASQEICFLPDENYYGFLRDAASRVKVPFQRGLAPGPVIDKEGRFLGEHRGIGYYTIGQRQGLGIAAGYPLYVVRIDAKRNAITVGKKADAYESSCLVEKPHFIAGPLKKKVAYKVKIRYNHTAAAAELKPAGRAIKVVFHHPQFAVTPGQSAVFYDGERVAGGGIIERVIHEHRKDAV